MSYLKNLGFSDELIDLMIKNIPNAAVTKLTEEEHNVTANIKYLKDLGINNYVEAFLRFYNMFLLDANAFDEIFSKYDREDLIAKLEKNIAIMEYL
ncbi:MAG TPA: hypothetical protein DCE23_01670 [Firmicutes bacterium]|nr:hypothetical protein [Bacillota bacterium]